MRRIIALAALCCASAMAQQDVWKFSRTDTIAGSTAITIALPASGENRVEILDYTLQCSVDCSVQTERNGTAPTATAGTWRPEDRDSVPAGLTQPAVSVFYNSNSASGLLHDEAFVFPAGAVIPWSVGQVIMTGNGATKNFTIRIAMTGTYRIQVRVRVRR